MILGKVVGNIWGSVKAQNLEGFKLLEIQPLSLFTKEFADDKECLEVGSSHSDCKLGSSLIVAVDRLGAGIGEYVIVAISTRVRDIIFNENIPIKALVLAIVDKAVIYKRFLP